MPANLFPCPFCGSQPVTRTDAQRQIYSVECPKCVSVGFHNHFRFGCMADAQWNERADIVEVPPSFFQSAIYAMEDSQTDNQQAKVETFKPGVCRGTGHGSCKGDTDCDKNNVCFRPA